MKTVYLVLVIALMGIVFINGRIEQAPSEDKPPVEGEEKISEIPTIPSPEEKLPPLRKPGVPPAPPLGEVIVDFIDSSYSVASRKTSGFFKTGQKADLMLSGIDFNNTGGPLLFNHPGDIATDGKHLLLADRNNNRVLIWNKLPEGNVAPDLVLGQKNFTTNNPGVGLDQLNWPVGVATKDGRVIVADTYNDRILIWNTVPTKNGQPADLVLARATNMIEHRGDIVWPWAVLDRRRKSNRYQHWGKPGFYLE